MVAICMLNELKLSFEQMRKLERTSKSETDQKRYMSQHAGACFYIFVWIEVTSQLIRSVCTKSGYLRRRSVLPAIWLFLVPSVP